MHAIQDCPKFFSVSGFRNLWPDLQCDSVTVVQDVVMELYRYVAGLTSTWVWLHVIKVRNES